MIGRAYYFLLKVRFAFLWLPLDSVEEALSKNSKKPFSKTDFRYSKKELLDLFHIAWRYQWKKSKCLPTSLAKQVFLSYYGFPTQLRIGVKKENGIFQAHAWCEDPKGVGMKSEFFEAIERL